eukprot:1182460-Prorocentrum_minimum.AAC.1
MGEFSRSIEHGGAGGEREADGEREGDVGTQTNGRWVGRPRALRAGAAVVRKAQGVHARQGGEAAHRRAHLQHQAAAGPQGTLANCAAGEGARGNTPERIRNTPERTLNTPRASKYSFVLRILCR